MTSPCAARPMPLAISWPIVGCISLHTENCGDRSIRGSVGKSRGSVNLREPHLELGGLGKGQT